MTPGETYKSLSVVLERLGVGAGVGVGVEEVAQAGVVMLVCVEVVIGVMLMVWGSVRVRWAASVLLGMFAVYGLGLIVMRVPVGCGCGVAIKLPGVDDRWFSIARASCMAWVTCPGIVDKWFFGQCHRSVST